MILSKWNSRKTCNDNDLFPHIPHIHSHTTDRRSCEAVQCLLFSAARYIQKLPSITQFCNSYLFKSIKGRKRINFVRVLQVANMRVT